jgi:hypothetical protein
VKKIVLASACILALALPAAAQNAQPSDGASSQGNVGPGAPQGTMKNETGSMNKGTTGASSRPHPAATPALPARALQPAPIIRAPPQHRVP